jgi:hypothetical protein
LLELLKTRLLLSVRMKIQRDTLNKSDLSFPLKREPSYINKLDTRLRGMTTYSVFQ